MAVADARRGDHARLLDVLSSGACVVAREQLSALVALLPTAAPGDGGDDREYRAGEALDPYALLAKALQTRDRLRLAGGDASRAEALVSRHLHAIDDPARAVVLWSMREPLRPWFSTSRDRSVDFCGTEQDER